MYDSLNKILVICQENIDKWDWKNKNKFHKEQEDVGRTDVIYNNVYFNLRHRWTFKTSYKI